MMKLTSVNYCTILDSKSDWLNMCKNVHHCHWNGDDDAKGYHWWSLNPTKNQRSMITDPITTTGPGWVCNPLISNGPLIHWNDDDDSPIRFVQKKIDGFYVSSCCPQSSIDQMPLITIRSFSLSSFLLQKKRGWILAWRNGKLSCLLLLLLFILHNTIRRLWSGERVKHNDWREIAISGKSSSEGEEWWPAVGAMRKVSMQFCSVTFSYFFIFIFIFRLNSCLRKWNRPRDDQAT